MMRELSIHVVLYREESRCVAHCLEFDLVAQGADSLEAFRNLLDAIELQAQYAVEIGDWGLLFNPAPAEYWRMLVEAERFTPDANGWKLPAFVSRVDCSLLTK